MQLRGPLTSPDFRFNLAPIHNGICAMETAESAGLEQTASDQRLAPPSFAQTGFWLAAREGRAAFNPARAPLLRLRLFRLAPKENVLVLSMHHAVTDGWSMSKL